MTVRIARSAAPATPPALTESVRGIPFYTKTAACRHQAIWIERRYEVTYSHTVAGDPAASLQGHKILGQSEYGDIARLTQVSGQALVDPEQRKQYRALFGRLLNTPEATAPVVKDAAALTQDRNAQLISDTASPQPYVDYSTLYYYNTARPLIGTSKADVHLAPDGTLTEGASELVDTTGSTIASLVTSLAGMAVGPEGAAPALTPNFAGPPPAGTSDTFTISVVNRTYLHAIEEWSRETKDPSTCTTTWRNPPAYSANTVTLEAEESADKKEAASRDTLRFKGEVQLPRADDGKGRDGKGKKDAAASPDQDSPE